MANTDENFELLRLTLQEQFLSCYPVANIQWQDIPHNLTWEQQAELIESTYAHPLNQRQPVKHSYQVCFLKKLLHLLEGSVADVHDAYYTSYCQLQSLPFNYATDDNYAYRHFLLTAYGVTVTVRESKNIVAEGTTGLCTWQASLALADFLLHNPQLIIGTNILELGAGTGFCSIALKACLQDRVKRVYMTDGSIDCVNRMRENISRNFNAEQQIDVEAAVLLWDKIEDFQWKNKSDKPDIVLAADVVYNEEHFPALLHALDYLFNMCDSQLKCLLAVTVRNEQTLQTFIGELEKLKFMVIEDEVQPLAESYIHWDRTTPVKLFIIIRK